MSTHWVSRPQDPYLRTVVSSELVQSAGTDRLFALRLACGHTAYVSRGKHRSDYAPQTCRCKRCIQEAIGDKPLSRRLSPAETAVAIYVSGAGVRVGVMDAARTALALEASS